MCLKNLAKTKHGTEIIKNSTGNANMFRSIKTVKHLKAQSFVVDFRSISNHSPFIYKPTQTIHDKQVPNDDFNE